ncbi:hypothetical protein ACFSO7_06380 [Bacillus sp. CGMCC 1.16607]|uniref:hypothetical protein n=1 Tax=Bacillus sp. CGMCC 1.16607 TaxID=3351842 RepID=UPI0036319C74
MNETKWIRYNLWLLLIIIPLSLVGYWFAVNKESLFYLYEWSVYLILLASIIVAFVGIVKVKSDVKWVSFSILAFLLQFVVLCLFLGPLSFSGLFYVFYILAIIALATYIIVIKKTKKYRLLSIIFFILTVMFILYMIILHSLWGNDLSFITLL